MNRVLVLSLIAANLLFFAWARMADEKRPQLHAVIATPHATPVPTATTPAPGSAPVLN
jgi:multisubunit Na+/H+ antiporter MnhC subunit